MEFTDNKHTCHDLHGSSNLCRNKIFTTKQISEIDRYTILNEPVADIDLMERAALKVAEWLMRNISPQKQLLFFAGPGNNGGDALAVARMMADKGYNCNIWLLDEGKELNGSPAINKKRVEEQGRVKLNRLTPEETMPVIQRDTVVVDGLFGSGLSRSLDGLAKNVANLINSSGAYVVSIDIPSGLFGEDNSTNNLSTILQANSTLTFEFPKLSFFFAEHEKFVGYWEVLPIGLHKEAIALYETPYYFITGDIISSKLTRRSRFAHKGNFGHALLIAGSRGKMGAAVLASKACLRAGVGLLTTHVPNTGMNVIHSAVPEAMCSPDASDLMFTEFPEPDEFSAIGVGPGIGTKPNACRGMHALLLANPRKMVIDADALNILAMHPEWLDLIPENAVLTPHPKEFERLAGKTYDSWSRLQLQRQFSARHKVIIVLKGGFTSVSFPDGTLFFNTTGNPGMATAGSGDVLTGFILGLLAQQYAPHDAAIMGVYLHGLAGDLAAGDISQESLTSGDLIDYLGKAFISIRNKGILNSEF